MVKSKSPEPDRECEHQKMKMNELIIDSGVWAQKSSCFGVSIELNSDCPIANMRHSDLFVVSLVLRDLPFPHLSLHHSTVTSQLLFFFS